MDAPRSVFITSLLNGRGDAVATITRNPAGLYVVTITDTEDGELLDIAQEFHDYRAAFQYATNCMMDNDDENPF